MTRSLSALGTSCSFMNSRTLFNMSWYLAVADVICWMMVVTWPKMVAYSSAAETELKRRCIIVLLYYNSVPYLAVRGRSARRRVPCCDKHLHALCEPNYMKVGNLYDEPRLLLLGYFRPVIIFL